VAYLEEGDVADVRCESYAIFDAQGQRANRSVVEMPAGGAAVELGPYRHFMQKEIFEQPRAVADTLEAVGKIEATLFGARAAEILPRVNSVLIIACGTSYYSSLVAKEWIETLARIPCTVEIASEYRYRDSVPHPDALVVVVSQSATADTLAALKHAKSLGHAHTLAIAMWQRARSCADGTLVPDARWRGDRRRVDEGVLDAARRAIPAGADAGKIARKALCEG
jgi:glucosamine--fructose-6-phosphate aminotransferase (isomerizing)